MIQPYDDNQDEPARQEMITLMISYLDNRLDAEATARLDTALQQSTELRELFVTVCMHRRLMYGWLGQTLSNGDSTDADADEHHQTILSEIIEIEMLERLRGVAASNRANEVRKTTWLDQHPVDPTQGARHIRHIVIPRAVFWGAIAALVLVSTLLIAPLFSPDTPGKVLVETDSSPQVLVATVIKQDQAVWAEGQALSHPTAAGEVYNKPLQLDAGSVKLRFLSGAEVTITAPAFIEPVAANRIKLSQGSLVGYCPTRESHGFTVDTPSCRVVDTGTEFGVVVAGQGSAECHVFSGRVEVAAVVDGEVQPQFMPVTEGYAVRAADGEVLRDIAMSTEKFGRPYIPLLAGVRSSSRQPYEVVPRGLTEGVVAFSDRLEDRQFFYTWRDIPAFLLSADYLRTANDDGTEADFQATLKISRPAIVYILWHPAVPAPKWLTDRFVQTGSHVRLEGSKNTGAALELYGKPRDLEFQVWRCTMDSAGELQLRDVGSRRASGGMYAVAVTPITADSIATTPDAPAE